MPVLPPEVWKTRASSVSQPHGGTKLSLGEGTAVSGLVQCYQVTRDLGPQPQKSRSKEGRCDGARAVLWRSKLR